MKDIVHTKYAPEAVGPYSQAVKIKATEMLFCSGQIPIDANGNQIVSGSPAEEARIVMDNLKAIIEASGYSMNDVVKTTIYLTDLSVFNEVNEVYASYFRNSFPARSTVQVSALPKNATIEIDMVACK
jgi:2-iminobutanoate/2-iminopropanoate deaminase